jgi:flagellar protein FliO/FliZ
VRFNLLLTITFLAAAVPVLLAWAQQDAKVVSESSSASGLPGNVNDKPELLVSEEMSDASSAELSLGWTLLRTFAVLGIVVALAYLVLNVGLRKLMGIEGVVAGKSIVRVLERTPLDQKRTLFVVKAANEVFLLGGSDSNLQLLSKLDAAEVELLRAAQAAEPSVLPAKLSPFLKRLLKKKGQ